MQRQEQVEALKAAAFTAHTPAPPPASTSDWRCMEAQLIRQDFDSSLLCPASLPTPRASLAPSTSSSSVSIIHPAAPENDVLLAVAAFGCQSDRQPERQLSRELSGSLTHSPSAALTHLSLSGSCPFSATPQLTAFQNTRLPSPQCHPEFCSSYSMSPTVGAPVNLAPLSRLPPANATRAASSCSFSCIPQDVTEKEPLVEKSKSGTLQERSICWHTSHEQNARRSRRSFEIHVPALVKHDLEESSSGKPDLFSVHDIEQASLEMDILGDGVIGSITIVPVTSACGSEGLEDQPMSVQYTFH